MNFVVVTPILNGGRYLSECINSIRNQTHAIWTHIIVDAGSTDDSLEIAQRACDEDPRIQLIHAPNTSIYHAIDKGFSCTIGPRDILCWLNSDDMFLPWAFSEVIRAMSESTISWVTGQPALWDTDGALRVVLPRAQYIRSLIRRGWYHDNLLGHIQQESTFFKRALYDELSAIDLQRFQEAKLAGDYHLWRAFAKHEKLVSVPTVLSGYRTHNHNRSRLEANQYYQEMAEFGAPNLPQPMVKYARTISDILSAIKLIYTTRSSLKRVNDEAIASETRPIRRHQ